MLPDKSKAPEMFNKIARRYDLVNRVVSFGIDRGWRRKLSRSVARKPGAFVLDLATGTGDVALDLLRRGKVSKIVGVDPSQGMLEVAQQKVKSDRASFQVGDAQALSFPDASFDAVTIAFGIRNVPDFDKALREMHRVLRTHGRVYVLEFSMPESWVVRKLHLFYLRHILPNVAALITGNKSAYQYLDKTIEAFPHGEAFCEHLRAAGFTSVSARPLTFGIASIYIGEKL